MSLTDKETLQLTDLCNQMLDGTISDAQRAELGEWLRTSVEARKFYVRFTGLSASLHYYAGEMQTEARDGAAGPPPKSLLWKWVTTTVLAAASLALIFWLATTNHAIVPPAAAASTNEAELIARLTGSKDCQWNSMNLQLGSRLSKGDRIDLAAGFAEITFDCGAKVVLEGPASLNVNSAWSATLNTGRLKAKLPPEAIGFSVSNSTVKVVDLGTEFAMIADPKASATEVLVLKGQVEAAANSGVDQQAILLSANESRRFAPSGISGVENSAEKFGEMNRHVSMDQFVPPVSYAHWSFDEVTGSTFHVDTIHLTSNASDIHLEKELEPGSAANHTRGKWDQALHFDGHLYGKAGFEGISDNSPHTVAFWVNVPKDASLANAYAMVAWGAQRPQLGTHPIHIGWNRNADEGTIGVLRTDYGGGYALGATPLRDGQWHHVAVVFMPRNDAESPMEVKQYLDGRLEGEGAESPPGSDVFRATSDKNAANSDTLWVGTRLGIKNVRLDRFTGRMDELYVVNRALEPQEIVALMNSNHL